VTVRHLEKTARADARGARTLWYAVGQARPGRRVPVHVLVARHRRTGSCSTWFTPRGDSSHPRPITSAPSSPTTAPSPPSSQAWCTATASVYNPSRNWNNVYVHSNQPYESATASADGYSWSYETNGSGYAEIYLNGPPPGVTITVTVGGATCTTSD
jgi:hypothetical protein